MNRIVAAVLMIIFFLSTTMPALAQSNEINASQLPVEGTAVIRDWQANTRILYASIAKRGCIQIEGANISLHCFDKSTLVKITIRAIPHVADAKSHSIYIQIHRRGDLLAGFDKLRSEVRIEGFGLQQIGRYIQTFARNTLDLLEATDWHCVGTVVVETRLTSLTCDHQL